MTKWPVKSLRGRIHVKHGFSFKGEHFKSTGRYVVLTPGNFHEAGGFKRNEGKDKCYSEPFPDEYLLKKGDVIVAMTEQTDGLLGSMATVPESDHFLHNQRLGLVTALTPDVDVSFLYHLFKTKSVREQIRRSASGSKVKHTSPDRIYDVLVSLPPPEDQSRISAVLSALDAKIALNHRINAEFEAMAKLLYDYWFVQFDFPISAAQAAAMCKPKLEGKPYRTSGGPMVFNPDLKREIPEDWKVYELGHILSISRGASPRPIDEFLSDSGIPWIKISDATASDNRFILGTKQFILKEGGPMAKIVPPDTLILTNSATPAVPRITKIHSGVHDGWLVISGYTLGLTKDFMFHYFSHERPRIICLGNGSIFKNLKTDYIKGLKISLPPDGVSNEITTHFKQISDLIYNVTQQNQELTSLRDWLLPMLMNGQVTVGGEVSCGDAGIV